MNSSDLSEVYGLRNGRIAGVAIRSQESGIWNVYLANGVDETSFNSGRFRVHPATTIEEVKKIFKCEELEFRASEPQYIPIPDRAIFDRDWGKLLPYSVFNHPLVAKKLGELMRLAAERGMPNEPKAPPSTPKK